MRLSRILAVPLAGEVGAVLESTTHPLPADEVHPALWVHGASGVVIRGIEMRPAGAIGNTNTAGSYPNVKVKNCGNNNQVNGGILVDNTVDPCN